MLQLFAHAVRQLRIHTAAVHANNRSLLAVAALLLSHPRAPPAIPPGLPPPASQGRYATLGMARTPADWRNLTIFIVLVAGALGANSMYKSANTARTDRRRKQALASLEKDQ
jgi:hypothetical protein